MAGSMVDADDVVVAVGCLVPRFSGRMKLLAMFSSIDRLCPFSVNTSRRYEIRRCKTGPDQPTGLNRDLGNVMFTNSWNALFRKL